MRDHLLRAIERLTEKPDAEWSPTERAAFPDSINGVPEAPQVRVARSTDIFADELATLHRVLDQPQPLGDIELREAVYLAGRLLSTVTGYVIDLVDRFPEL